MLSQVWQWWHTPLIPALRRQMNLCEFEVTLVYKNQFQDRPQSYRKILSQEKKQNKTMQAIVTPPKH